MVILLIFHKMDGIFILYGFQIKIAAFLPFQAFLLSHLITLVSTHLN